MNQSELSTVVKNANAFLKKQFATFIECVWNEDQKCLIYQFKSDVDAEQFMLWKQTQGNQFRMEKHIYHASLTAVREYRP